MDCVVAEYGIVERGAVGACRGGCARDRGSDCLRHLAARGRVRARSSRDVFPEEEEVRERAHHGSVVWAWCGTRKAVIAAECLARAHREIDSEARGGRGGVQSERSRGALLRLIITLKCIHAHTYIPIDTPSSCICCSAVSHVQYVAREHTSRKE